MRRCGGSSKVCGLRSSAEIRVALLRKRARIGHRRYEHTPKKRLVERIMRIGIVPAVNPSWGGVYQYSLTMLHALDVWKSDGCEDEFVVFASGAPHPALVQTTGHGWML